MPSKRFLNHPIFPLTVYIFLLPCYLICETDHLSSLRSLLAIRASLPFFHCKPHSSVIARSASDEGILPLRHCEQSEAISSLLSSVIASLLFRHCERKRSNLVSPLFCHCERQRSNLVVPPTWMK